MTDFNKPKLYIELVPSSSWFENLRSLLPNGGWDLVRKAAYKRAGYRCEICGGKGEKWPVEAHEEFSYSDSGVQRLERVVALCPSCHQVKHFGLAQIQGKDQEALEHLMNVNTWTREQAQAHVHEAFSVWQHRSALTWTLNIERTLKWVEEKLEIPRAS